MLLWLGERGVVMFGYVTICEPELKMKDWRKYRAYYCGLCQSLRKRHGHVGQLTLSYDMTFAVILLTSLYESEPEVSEHRCKTHPVKKQKMLQNEITDYCADMNVLLSYYHMKDNWEDEKKISGLAGSVALGRKSKRIAEKYPRQSKVIQEKLKELAAYEAADSQNIDEPAGCFGRLMAEMMVYKEDAWEKTLREIGFYLGKFIYIMDAYEDLEKDLQKGCYNPLRTLYENGGCQVPEDEACAEAGKCPAAGTGTRAEAEECPAAGTGTRSEAEECPAAEEEARTEGETCQKPNFKNAYQKRCYDMLCMMIAECSAAFERLPCLWDVDILRNILYAGVWGKFQKLQG